MNTSHHGKQTPLWSLISENGEVMKRYKRTERNENAYVDAVSGDVFIFPVDKALVVVPAISRDIRRFENNEPTKTMVLPLKYQPVEPQSKTIIKNGNRVVVPTIDYLVQDAVMAPDKTISLLVNDKSTTENSKAPQSLLFLETTDLEIKRELKLNGHAMFFDFLGDRHLVFVIMNENDDFEFQLFEMVN